MDVSLFSYHDISIKRFDVIQEDLFTISIIAKYNHSRGARWMNGIYSGMVELHTHNQTEKNRNLITLKYKPLKNKSKALSIQNKSRRLIFRILNNFNCQTSAQPKKKKTS